MKTPLSFSATAQSKSGIAQSWNIETSGFTNSIAIPPEFNGPGGALSPEDLYIQALTNCFIGTFKVYAENSKLQFDDLQVSSQLTVDLNEQKKVCMKSCHFIITITNASNASKAELLVKKAIESGFILNSIKTELSYELTLR